MPMLRRLSLQREPDHFEHDGDLIVEICRRRTVLLPGMASTISALYRLRFGDHVSDALRPNGSSLSDWHQQCHPKEKQIRHPAWRELYFS